MNPRIRGLILTQAQAACLTALKNHNESKTDIAIHAELDLKKTARALHELEELNLIRRDEVNRWHLTGLGKNCRFTTVPGQMQRVDTLPGPAARRLLELLDRPMRGRDLAERLGVTVQRVRQLVVKLHAQGRVRFGDRERILHIVSRISDKTPLLSRDEEHVLSAIPDDYATNATKIRLAVGLPEKTIPEILKCLVAKNYVAAFVGFADEPVYRITAVGSRHPQRDQSARLAQAPRLPVESDRVHSVLSTILDAQSLRIKDVRDALKIPQASTNALMQYLKRKKLVQKTGQEANAPYVLTDKGLEALAEMTRRHAA